MAEQKVMIDNEAVPVSQTKTIISLNAPTPAWVTWVFRTEFVLNKFILFILAGTSLISPENIKEAVLWVTALDLATWTMGRFIGLKKDDFGN